MPPFWRTDRLLLTGRQGLAGLWARAARFVGARVFVDETIVLMERTEHVRQSSPAKVVRATEDRLEDLFAFQSPLQIAEFRRFLACGDVGYLAYLDGRCVHRSWLKQGPQRVSLHRLLPMGLTEGQAFVHYCETASEARGRNIYPSVLAQIGSDTEGRRLFIAISARNEASIRGALKGGFSELERRRLLVIFGIHVLGTDRPPKAPSLRGSPRVPPAPE